MKYNILKGGAIFCVGLMMASCSDFLDVDPRNKISDAAVWSNVDLANAALNDCYTYVEGENEMVCHSQAIQMMYIIVQVMPQRFILWVLYLVITIMWDILRLVVIPGILLQGN